MFLPTAMAQDLSTTNVDLLTHFWAAAEATTRPVTVISFGDSVANSYASPTYSVINMMVGSIGVAGYSLNNYGNATLYNLTNGVSVVVGPTPLWFSDYYQLPPGGGLWWWNQNSVEGVYSDKLGVFWVAQPQGGQMTFSVSTEGGPWTPLLTLNGYAAAAVGQYTNVVLTPDWHQIRVDGVSGTNCVIGPQLLLQTTSGVHVVFMDKGGIAISDVTNVPSAIRAPIFAALSPDLLIWHMKEDGSTTTSNGLIYCEQWWSNAAPSCDVVYIGTPYTAYDTNPATPVTVEQNTLVRYIALQYNRAYCDLMDPSVSWPWMNSLGFMSDAVHYTYNGGQYLAGFMWNELFYALGAGLPPSPGYTGAFTAAPTVGAAPLTVTFADISNGSITNWYWSFGDGSITDITTKSALYTYATAGTYTVTETVSGPGGSLTNTQVNYIKAVAPPRTASFTAAPTVGVAPLTVTFTDTSTGATNNNWFWSFGDGSTTNVLTTTVSHTYVAAGTYTVTETVSGPGGSSTTTPTFYVTVLTPVEGQQFQAWQTQYFNCTNCPQGQMSADADGTGQNNLFKLVAGLDPTNPASVFLLQMANMTNQPSQENLVFSPIAAGRLYTPQFCTDLVSGVWLPLTGYAGPVTNGSQVTIADQNVTQPSKFYRIVISQPAALAPFVITSITRSGTNVNLVWNGQFGSNIVQVSSSPSTGGYTNNFVNLAVVVMPGFGPTNYTEIGGAANHPSRFYRINLPQ
jgi:PKD repeat protein